MLPFSVALRPGEPVADQVVYAVTRAIVSGQLRAGDRFPSVRTLSQELRVNPNTAQRIVSILIEQRLLEVQPGIGTTVLAPGDASLHDRAAFDDRFVAPFVVEGRRVGLSLQALIDLIRQRWRRMDDRGSHGTRDRD
jgi:GntR family transcriptional regulator